MLKLKKIAITGGAASGKSSVCQFFGELGAYVVKADALVHELLDSDPDLEKQVVRKLGPEILENGKISRKLIAEKVFASKQLLYELEAILHPAVLQKIDALFQQAKKSGNYPLFVAEIPLLFEIKKESLFDVVIAVIAEESIARRRFEQMGFKKDEYDRRMERQLPPPLKAEKADYTIYNNGTLEDLKDQVKKLNRILQSI